MISKKILIISIFALTIIAVFGIYFSKNYYKFMPYKYPAEWSNVKYCEKNSNCVKIENHLCHNLAINKKYFKFVAESFKNAGIQTCTADEQICDKTESKTICEKNICICNI